MPTVPYVPKPRTVWHPPTPCGHCGQAPIYKADRCIGCYSYAAIMNTDRPLFGRAPLRTLAPLSVDLMPPPRIRSRCANKECASFTDSGGRCTYCQRYFARHKRDRTSDIIAADKARKQNGYKAERGG